MTGVQTIFRAEVLDEQSLREVASAMTALTREENDVIVYEWSLSSDGKELRVFESFFDSKACLDHMGHMAELSPKLTESVKLLEIEVYGEPSEEFVEATKDYPIIYMNNFEGFRR